MKKSAALFALLVSLMLPMSGCVSPNQLVERQAPPSTTNGYIGGLFSGAGAPVGPSANYVLVFTELASGKTHALPFFAPGEGGYHAEKARLIEVPPGRYRFAYWASYRQPFDEILAKNEQAPGGLGEIEVQPARVTMVGRFRVSDQYASVNESVYRIEPLVMRPGEAARVLGRDFPGYVVAEVGQP